MSVQDCSLYLQPTGGFYHEHLCVDPNTADNNQLPVIMKKKSQKMHHFFTNLQYSTSWGGGVVVMVINRHAHKNQTELQSTVIIIPV